MPRALRSLLLLAALGASGVLAGCAEDVAPAGGLTESYTLWGALDPTASQQRIRVVRVTPTPAPPDTGPLPATVTSTDAATGAVTTWRDSLVTFPDGSVGHVFVASLQPAFGSVHVVRVTDPERPEVSAVVRVPTRAADPILLPTVRRQNSPEYQAFWPDAPRFNRARVRYTFLDPACEPTVIERALPPTQSVPVEFGWRVSLPMEVEVALLSPVLGSGPKALAEIRISGEVASEDWRPPGGTFDPEVLVDPYAFGNVTGGFGFVGAAYPSALTWTPTPADLSGTPYAYRYPGCGG